ncbi:uncharacterized protein Dana_GF28186, isoform B [Drosophila ananassae]|uniref:Uncharacterized protein, isoform B n=1 Tax=Drosophila ananassae TaxID=7217 RepID=A0A0P8XXI6_DROAN|nr:uncharacterized protein Dana_GF28186, isoform B [Drosophila ananassae]
MDLAASRMVAKGRVGQRDNGWSASRIIDYAKCPLPWTMPRKQRLKQRERKDSEGVSGCTKGLLGRTAVSGNHEKSVPESDEPGARKYPLTGHRTLDTARVFSPIREIIVSVIPRLFLRC